jgi:hypothetical protein
LLTRRWLLTSLQMNSNPLGSDGARSIMRAMRREGDDRSIGIENCTLHDSFVFDPTKPSGLYSLDLSLPYDRVGRALRCDTFSLPMSL